MKYLHLHIVRGICYGFLLAWLTIACYPIFFIAGLMQLKSVKANRISAEMSEFLYFTPNEFKSHYDPVNRELSIGDRMYDVVEVCPGLNVVKCKVIQDEPESVLKNVRDKLSSKLLLKHSTIGFWWVSFTESNIIQTARVFLSVFKTFPIRQSAEILSGFHHVPKEPPDM
ncbi:MAG: hypothetical protein JST70_17450 [Bacteroidetes bacterium]|nr:hypothetical protein [Bacteroidota bacterium]